MQDGDTAFHKAAYGGNCSVLEALIKSGADMHGKNKVHASHKMTLQLTSLMALDTLLYKVSSPRGCLSPVPNTWCLANVS